MLNDFYNKLDPVAFTFGDISIRWYGIAYILGFTICAIIMALTAKKWRIHIEADKFLAGLICGIIGVIIGARLGYCLFYGDGFYINYPMKILAINEGGMSFHGGFIGGLIGGVAGAKIMQIKYLRLLDLAFIGVPVGLMFGRFANFINGELWGAPTSLPWGVNFGGIAGDVFRHPSQLYEAALEGFVILIVLLIMRNKKPPFLEGTYFAVFSILYGIFRFAVEFVREPDAQLGYIAFDWLTMGQILSVPLIIIGIVILCKNIPESRRIKKEMMTIYL